VAPRTGTTQGIAITRILFLLHLTVAGQGCFFIDYILLEEEEQGIRYWYKLLKKPMT
jgi:hypothetical protein